MDSQEDFSPRLKKIKIETVSGAANYMIKEMLATERSTFLLSTGQIFGSSAGYLLENVFVGKLKTNDMIAITGTIVESLYNKADPATISSFIKSSILSCLRSPKSACETSDSYETHFCKYYDHIPFLLSEIYKHNFGASIHELKKKLLDLGLITLQSSEKKKPTAEAETVREEPIIPSKLVKSVRTSVKPNFLPGTS